MLHGLLSKSFFHTLEDSRRKRQQGSRKVLRIARDFSGRGDARQWAYIFALLAKMELNVLCVDEVRFRVSEKMNKLNFKIKKNTFIKGVL